MAMIKAAVVLPTHNDARDIRDHLRTVLAQQQKLPSHVRLQVLVIDDNSPNGSGKLIHNLLSFNHNIKLISSMEMAVSLNKFAYALGAMGRILSSKWTPTLITTLFSSCPDHGNYERQLSWPLPPVLSGGSFPENGR